ncbi:hypothetical protein EXN66_Car003475 [Channa argus]|uniref:Uncharacterized protein n=1 Tax=Channa argus TaxID=215402 RepID=A0A6G1PC69_CHAAH|nr:hypothetical protein EXN66_Car003475 [Channa argus]
METRQKRVAKLWTTALQMGQPEPDGGPKSKEDPSVINGRHTAEEPSGERKQEQNDKESWGGSKRHGKENPQPGDNMTVNSAGKLGPDVTGHTKEDS